MRIRTLLFTSAALLLAANGARGKSFGKSLTSFSERQQRTTKKGMLTLGSWAMGNFVVSGILLNRPEEDRYYRHQMNIMWNVVNVVLAGVGYYQAARKVIDSLSFIQVVNYHHSLRRKLLFNAGLDVAYVVGGGYLLKKAENEPKQPKRWQGYGQSLILQGAFLFTFDTVFYYVVRSYAKPLDSMMRERTASNHRLQFSH